jgi:diguanylate cyclase (GGDEF)-like protein
MKLNNTRLAIVVFSVLLVGFFLTSFLSYSATSKLIETSAFTQTLPLISDNIYSVIKQEINDPINVSSIMANDAFLINWVTSGEKNLHQIQDYLELILKKYGFTTSFFVSDITTNYYYSKGILKQISVEDDHDVWFYNFKKLNKPLDLDVDNDEAKKGLLTVFINHRLEDSSGTFLGVVGVGLKLTQISEKFREYERQFEHKIYMVDRNGLIQIHPDDSYVEQINIKNLEGISDISQQILTPSETIWISEYSDSLGKKAISVRYIQEFDWFLIVEKDNKGSLANARTSLFQNIGIGSAIAGVVSIIIYLVIKTFNKQLNFLASSDELTKASNRHSFLPLLRKAIKNAARNNFEVSLLMIDIDNFKSVNDLYGHFTGDKLLIEVVKTIEDLLRSSDLLVRWGGDEFCAYLHNADQKIAVRIASRIQKSIEKLFLTTKNGISFSRTVSIGVSSLKSEETSAEDLIKNADEALLKAKKKGKNKFEIFTPPFL